MAPARAAGFDLSRWLAEQDVTDRDETLDDQCARVYLLHLRLSSSDGGVSLARTIVDAENAAAVASIAALVDSDEPRFAVMALVDLLGALRGGDEDGDARRLVVAMTAIAAAVPTVVGVLVRKAGEGDVCEDAMSYALTLLSFMLGEDGRLEPCVRAMLREEAARPAWLKASMRLWRDAEVVAHVPGVDAPDFERGLGFVVTVFLGQVVAPVNGRAGGDGTFGRAALVGMGAWSVSFLSMRLYAAHVTEDERTRLVDVLWACCVHDAEFAREFIFEDAATVRAIANSASAVGAEEEMEAGACSALSDDADEMGCGSADGSDDGKTVEGSAVDPEMLLCASRTAACVFAHARLMQHALRDGERAPLRRRRFLRRHAPRAWFWDAMRHCADLCYSFAGYEVALGDRCADFIQAPCARSALSLTVWRAAEWLATDTVTWRAADGGAVLSRGQILERVASVSNVLCQASAEPLVAQSALNLAMTLLKRQSGAATPVAALSPNALNVCEWCLSSDTRDSPHLQACGGCGLTFYCDQDHMRLHWRRFHRRSCAGKGGDAFAGSAFVVDAGGVLQRRVGGEQLDAALTHEGVESVMRACGPMVERLGKALRMVEGRPAGHAAVHVVPRGCVVREVSSLLRSGRAGAEDVVAAMIMTCRQNNGSSVLGCWPGVDRGRRHLGLFRATSRCTRECSGCAGHDSVCSTIV
jgi:MYND finger